jgi:copper(I)-binding protein
MKPVLRSTLAVASAAAALLAGAVIAPAVSAHEPPKPGSSCAMSGMVEDNHGTLYVCTSRKAGAKPTWSKGLPASRSPLTIADGWAKAADKGMSAGFGMIKNPTNKPIRVIGVTSPNSTFMQLHEVVMKDGSMVMQQKQGGFVIPAKGMTELKPGGNHLMFMKLTKPITAGAMIPITLITADGGQLKTTILGKVYSGANETYDGGMGDMNSMSGM